MSHQAKAVLEWKIRMQDWRMKDCAGLPWEQDELSGLQERKLLDEAPRMEK